jgi:class 3 adenylate cyclase
MHRIVADEKAFERLVDLFMGDGVNVAARLEGLAAVSRA